MSVQKDKRETSQVCKKRSTSKNSSDINPINDLKKSIDDDVEQNGGDEELRIQDSDDE